VASWAHAERGSIRRWESPAGRTGEPRRRVASWAHAERGSIRRWESPAGRTGEPRRRVASWAHAERGSLRRWEFPAHRTDGPRHRAASHVCAARHSTWHAEWRDGSVGSRRGSTVPIPCVATGPEHRAGSHHREHRPAHRTPEARAAASAAGSPTREVSLGVTRGPPFPRSLRSPSRGPRPADWRPGQSTVPLEAEPDPLEPDPDCHPG
jgi:hypothetical protein